ncbi:LamG-like jellyroll fold domain-containing protein [uncultured Prevotella sp.]|uniref:LamG-like jellyroll fold domain-containing protein n=1 Tax=uncultured Prevotella sp. TaxID=159272 RepID=UPI0025D8409C|nr:LamG-like jellyroll fold domain-containing protein [uncultured Prevotella sp.]
MTKIIQSQRPRHWCTSLFLVAIALFFGMPQVHAEDLYVNGDMQNAITFTNTSPGVIKIRVAICCDYMDTNGLAHWKTIQLDGSKSNIRLKYIPKGKSEPEMCNFLGVWSNNTEGDYHAYYQYYLINAQNEDQHGSSLMFLSTNGSLTQIKGYPPIRQRQSLTETTYVEFEWYYPTHMVGQEVTFYYSGKMSCHDGNNNYWDEQYGEKEICTFTIGDDITLDAYDPVPCTEAGDEGKMMIPVVSSNTIDSLKLYNKAGKQLLDCVSDQPGNYMMLKVDATTSYDSLKYEPTIQLSTVYNAPVNSPTTVSGPYTKMIPDSLPMIHKPDNLSSELQGGSIKLTWDVNNLEFRDLLPGDMFQIQRKLPGQTDYEDLTMVSFDDTLDTYEYFDDKAITSMESKGIIKYRICRAGTAMWGWKKNPTVDSIKVDVSNVTGYEPKNLKSSQTNQDDRKVTITWQDNGGIWDSRGELSLITYIYSKDNNSNPKDSLTQTVTDEQRQQRSIEFTLPRSCVYYKFALRLDSITTPWLHNKLVVENTAPQYYDERALGHIKKDGLKATTLHSSVLLGWELENNTKPVDYFEVFRCIQGATDFECIATNLTDMQYEDKTVSPIKTYDYFVRSVTNCETLILDSTQTVSGYCDQWGRLEGYVRFADGTGIPNITVAVAPAEAGVSGEVTTKTDASGYFEVKNLSYYGGSTGTYTVSVIGIPSTDLRDDCAGGLPATFTPNAGGNDVSDLVFTVTKGYRISGYVMYEGTSIPVKGVGFTVDGNEVRSVQGAIETDYEGKFSFWTLQGQHTVNAVKKGHSFGKKGTYTANITQDVAGLYFYDQTRVTLIGRVAGGKDQGDLPLDNSLSRNNLGDNLKIVMELEGDHTSWLVYDNTHPSLTERNEEFKHRDGQQDNHKTRMYTTRHRIEIRPDAETGEYRVQLPPVAWKITQITAEGYATLFQEGKTGDVIDLTDSLTEHKDTVAGPYIDCDGKTIINPVTKYYAQYNRIYHAPVELAYKQLQTVKDTLDYFGEKNYMAQNLAGDKATVSLVYKKKDGTTCYAFGYPVFNIDRSYTLQLSAQETYYWNNDRQSDKRDVVYLSGGKVTIQNQMISATHREEVTLNDQGQAYYSLRAAQTPYMLTGEQALRTVSFTLALDGTTFEAEPLRAYVLNVSYKPGAQDILSINTPRLVDILRDPPGATSSAKISRGSTLKYAYTMDLKWAAGVSLNFTFGSGYTAYQGAWAGFGGGMTYTWPISTLKQFPINLDLVFSGSGQRAFSYAITTTEDIATSSLPTMVGADADVYIGMETNIFAKPAVAIRALPDSMFNQLKGELEAGRMVEIARGKDQNDSIVHLVRDEIVAYGDTVTSVFHHSQQYIIKQLIPELVEQCQSMLFTGTKEEAQAAANAKNEPIYWLEDSNVPQGTDSYPYKIFYPSSWEEKTPDRLSQHLQAILTWMSFIAQNEQEKLNATELVKNFDVDGGSTTSYTEDFTSAYSYSKMNKWPFSNGATDAFHGNEGSDKAGEWFATFFGSVLGNLIYKKLYNGNTQKETAEGYAGEDDFSPTWNAEFPTFKFSFSIAPVFQYDITPVNTESQQFNRRESFSISMDPKSHIDFDVYRVKTVAGKDSLDNTKADENRTTLQLMDVFTNDNFLKQVGYDYEYLDRHFDPKKWQYARSFVYRTRGGATCRPYEGERKTYFYQPGTVLDQATKRIENPIIKLDKQSVSGVPYGEPARFKIYLTNESEQPEAAYSYFGLYMDETSNAQGAKLMLDGMPMTGDLRTVKVVPGEVTEKTLEVYASEDFDYENLRIGIRSLGDAATFQEAQFSVHFLRTAGTIAISSPGDKWIMNTDAATDSRGYFMPVIISGFDKNQKNFDHIEFQYKESTRGDDYWTNLCAYYANDSLMALASGTKEKIPENGNITAHFYGDGVEMEKAYDLRAVLFVRNGSEYLTSSSKVLSGIKDTRRPRLFGQPEPKNGILGAGDDITFNFSEAIEHNYLSGITNFEVMGETNETNIQEETSLLFSGTGYAESEAKRNFADKNISVEMLIQPDDTCQDMPLFAHGVTGTEGQRLELWLTKDRKLKAIIKSSKDDATYSEYISTKAIGSAGFQHVALVLDNDKKQLRLYNDTLMAQFKDVTYGGSGTLIFGTTTKDNSGNRQYYSGRMLEGRVWNRAMDATLFANYGMRKLTGYEMGLVDYYPMDDGEGVNAEDKAQGAHLKLNGATWALPRGMSLYLDSKKTSEVDGNKMHGLKLKNKYFSRTAEADYTLMFWFKTAQDGTLISNGAGLGLKDETNARNSFFIGIENNSLKYRTNGHEYSLGKNFNDNSWHHYAMTVDRAHNTANIYVDRVLRQTFRTDSLGGMTGDNFYLGNKVWLKGDTLNQANPLTGYVDEVGLFSQALPYSLIKRYSMKAPLGTEKGLITYLSFSLQERDSQNQIVLEPCVLNKVIHTDMDGNMTDERDTVFYENEALLLKRVDKSVGAPVQLFKELKNLNFDFVGRDNQLMVNINEHESRINKRNLYVTVSDIPDMNGNYMASPFTATFFVDRNPLRWSEKTIRRQWMSGEIQEIELRIQNTMGRQHTYTIENMPRWMSASKTTDIIEPQSEDVVVLTIGPDLNVGSYDEIIYLTDEDGLAEPLTLYFTVEGEEPQWTVDPNLMKKSMSITGVVKMADVIVTDSRDIVAAFDANNNCRGTAHIDYDKDKGQALVYLTVYDNDDKQETSIGTTPFTFRLWHYNTGKTMTLQTETDITFEADKVVGTVKDPVIMTAKDTYIQSIHLKPGWNWVSFNVYAEKLKEVGDAAWKPAFNWENGDIIATDDVWYTYNDSNWTSDSDKPKSDTSIPFTSLLYRVKVSKDVDVEVTGSALKDVDLRTITVKNGWNGIGYTPMTNLPVNTALADYWSDAEDGDLIKNQHEFAIFTEGANGTREWIGSLRYMKPGEGYKLYRKADNNTTFCYPYVEPGATIGGSATLAPQRKASRFATTMNMVAEAVGVTLEEGDRLVAYARGEAVGEAVMMSAAESLTTQPVFFLSIEGEEDVPLSFAIERGGEIIATTGELNTYKANAVIGTPKVPTQISFVPTDQLTQQGWYTLEGIKLQKAPKKNGVYIFNGKKKVVR